MPIDKDQVIERLKEMAANAKPLECPEWLNDERLEDAFLISECDENGYSEEIPAIWNHYYRYGIDDEGILYIVRKSASIRSNLYSRYLDNEALLWDSANNRVLIYQPDPEEPKMAFKGSVWRYAKRLRSEYSHISLKDIYREVTNSANQERITK